jgi:hypothetical protein
MVNEFSAINIDEEKYHEFDGEDEDETHADVGDLGWVAKKKIRDHNIVQLKNNYIPRGLIPLERNFDQKDAMLKPSVKNVEEINRGTIDQPRLVKLSQTISLENK